jgi:hypothetical protein
MVAATDTVSVLVPAPGAAIDVGENWTVMPVGTPDTLRATAALTALLLVVVSFVVP